MHINNKISKNLWIHRQNLEVRNRQKITNEDCATFNDDARAPKRPEETSPATTIRTL